MIKTFKKNIPFSSFLDEQIYGLEVTGILQPQALRRDLLTRQLKDITFAYKPVYIRIEKSLTSIGNVQYLLALALFPPPPHPIHFLRMGCLS